MCTEENKGMNITLKTTYLNTQTLHNMIQTQLGSLFSTSLLHISYATIRIE